MQSAEVSTAGVSRSGRLRKKSTKLMEMEESEKVGDTSLNNNTGERNTSKLMRTSNCPTNNCTSLLQSSVEPDLGKPLKKKLKIKLSVDGNCVEETLGEEVSNNEDEEDEAKEVVPPFKIKLFGNSSKGVEAASVMSPALNSCKKMSKKVPIKPDGDGSLFNSQVKSGKVGRKAESETAANLLFKQITSGVTPSDNTKRRKKNRSSNEVTENVNFGSDDNFDGEETSLVIADSDESLAAAVAQAKKVKNPKTPKTSAEKREEKKAKQRIRAENKAIAQEGKEKKKRAPLITAYTLFARENRPKIHENYPELDFASVSKRLGEVWQALPPKEKMQWKKKALKMKEAKDVREMINTPKAKTVTQLCNIAKPSQKSATPLSNPSCSTFTRPSSEGTSHALLSMDERTPIGTDPADVAAHLKLLGESLSIIGQRLTEHSGQIAVSGSVSVLLDSTLCALGPLLCLTALNEHTNGCPEELRKQILDNVSYIMPGI